MSEVDEIDANIDDFLTADDHEEIELSSDEEPDITPEVSLVVLKRPPAIEPQEAIDILDSDEEFPLYVTEASKPENVNIVEKNGRVSEYIESEGLGMIFAEDYGLVLFHLSQVWVDGKQLSPAQTRARLEAGAEVTFYDQTLTGPEYGSLSKENILHQALVVWSGQRPRHLMRNMDQLGVVYMEELAGHREMFMVYVNGGVFIPCELAKVKGKVVGYITDRMGVIECQDEDRNRVNVFFHVDDVLVFKEPVGTWEQRFHVSPGMILPLGLFVSVDARKITSVDHIQYQAITVLAGSWPDSANIHSALPGGPGSFSQTYNVPDDHTFYYLELSREAKLVRNVGRLKEELERTGGEIIFTRRNTEEIRDAEDQEFWRQQFTEKPRKPRSRGQNFNKDVKGLFRAPPVRNFKAKRELDDSSSVVSGGESVGGFSGVSRPGSLLSLTSSCGSTRRRRDWYNPTNWRHGGLRIKEEIKTEIDTMEWEPTAKRPKMEK